MYVRVRIRCGSSGIAAFWQTHKTWISQLCSADPPRTLWLPSFAVVHLCRFRKNTDLVLTAYFTQDLFQATLPSSCMHVLFRVLLLSVTERNSRATRHKLRILSQESPFARAIQTASHVLVIPNDTVSTLCQDHATDLLCPFSWFCCWACNFGGCIVAA